MREYRIVTWPALAAWITLLVLAGGCGGQAVFASGPTPVSTAPTARVEGPSQGPVAEPTAGSAEAGSNHVETLPLVYTNDTFGFQLAFPKTWNGFYVGELDSSGAGSLCFSFHRAMPICILQIDVYTHAQWSRLQKLNNGYYLGENADYVFGAGPFTEECVQMDEFQCDRYHELPAILKSFEAK